MAARTHEDCGCAPALGRYWKTMVGEARLCRGCDRTELCRWLRQPLAAVGKENDDYDGEEAGTDCTISPGTEVLL
ncbi:primosomal protein N [Sesbania bispinosa]|nr:primosomal protein N [Sesbania bispinosa]